MICAPIHFPTLTYASKTRKVRRPKVQTLGGRRVEDGAKVKQKSPFNQKTSSPKTQYAQREKTATAERHARPRIRKKYTCKICLAFSESLFFFFFPASSGARNFVASRHHPTLRPSRSIYRRFRTTNRLSPLPFGSWGSNVWGLCMLV